MKYLATIIFCLSLSLGMNLACGLIQSKHVPASESSPLGAAFTKVVPPSTPCGEEALQLFVEEANLVVSAECYNCHLQGGTGSPGLLLQQEAELDRQTLGNLYGVSSEQFFNYIYGGSHQGNTFLDPSNRALLEPWFQKEEACVAEAKEANL